MKDKAKILVVDDEPVNAELLEAHLLPQGYQVLTALNGEEALKKVAGTKIDLILLDILMPGMDGFEVTRRLRADENTRLIPIVLITILKETEDRIKGIEAGCDEFISKPFDKNEVLARVKTLLKLGYYRSLLDEKEKFEYVLNHIEDGMVIFDSNLKITRFNQRAKDLLAINEDTVDFINHINELFKIHYEGGLGSDIRSKAVSFDLERPGTDTTKSLVLAVRTNPVKNPLGEISSIVMILNDMTQERKEEMFKQNFLGLISHKLRTPITVITGNASLLEEEALGQLNDKQKEAIGGILRKSHILWGLLEKLLGFTTINSRELDLSGEPIDLESYLPILIDPMIQPVKGKQVELNVDCPENTKIQINKAYFDLIIGNLIENAIKFNDKDVAQISVLVKKLPKTVEISISDNGSGIPLEEREKIFEKFYQIEKYFTGNVEGAGLGLALVKRLVTAYGGDIQLESRIGKATIFTLTLPAQEE